MSDWDFLWGLDGEEALDAMASGGTAEDWDYVEEQQRKEEKQKRNKAWDELKDLRDNGEISREEFKVRKAEIFE